MAPTPSPLPERLAAEAAQRRAEAATERDAWLHWDRDLMASANAWRQAVHAATGIGPDPINSPITTTDQPGLWECAGEALDEDDILAIIESCRASLTRLQGRALTVSHGGAGQAAAERSAQ